MEPRCEWTWYDTTMMVLVMLAAVMREVVVWFRLEAHRMVKFGLVGGSGAAIHLGVLAGLTSGVGLWYLAAAGVASVVNITWNFAINDLWTFKDRRKGNVLVRYGRYFGTMALTGGLYFGVLTALVEGLDMWYMAAAIIAVMAQVMANYILSYMWVWRRQCGR